MTSRGGRIDSVALRGGREGTPTPKGGRDDSLPPVAASVDVHEHRLIAINTTLCHRRIQRPKKLLTHIVILESLHRTKGAERIHMYVPTVGTPISLLRRTPTCPE